MLSSNCALCDGQKSRFIKKQKASGIWSSLDLKTLGFHYLVILCFECIPLNHYKENEIVDKFLWALDKYMTEMHLMYLMWNIYRK